MNKGASNIDIKQFLPHRGKMLMVDQLLYIDHETVRTNFKIREECIFVHAKQLRESGLIEHMAQTCSSIVGKSFFEDDDVTGEHTKVIGFISAIKSVELLQLPTVDDIIETQAQLVSRFDGEGYSLSTMQCEVKLKTLRLAKCEMNLFIQEV